METRAGHSGPDGHFVDAPGGSLIQTRAINTKIQERVPDGARITYVNNSSQVSVMGWDGGQYGPLNVIGSTPTTGSSPAFSPDGTRIAFVSNRDKDPDRTYNNDLWVVPAAGGPQAPTRLTTFRGDDNSPDYTSSYPAWSPDGRSIAYVQGGPVELFSYGTRHLAVIPASGGEPHIVTGSLDRNVGNPIWSADGKTLRFIVEDDKMQYLASVPAAGGAVRRITNGKSVVWAQDEAKGHAVALVEDFTHPPEVFALDGANLRRLSPSVDGDETVLDAADSCPAMAITVTDGGREIGPRP